MKNIHSFTKQLNKSSYKTPTKRTATGGYLKIGQKLLNGAAYIGLFVNDMGIKADAAIDGERTVKHVAIDNAESNIRSLVKDKKALKVKLAKTKKQTKKKDIKRDISSVTLTIKYYETLLNKAQKL